MDKDNIIFSTIPAKKINKYAAEKIAHYIIITCNYNPNTNFISSDAIYISAIQNLYKFLIDSGIANKLTDLCQIMPIAKRFSYNKRLIGMLRTKICHNKNKSNDIEMIEEQYANWVRSVINKNVPSSLADYDKLKEMLMEIGQELVEDIINFIDDSLNHNKKEEIKEGIEKLKDAKVAVFGIGGVGGYACEALVRSGIGAFDLIDDDKVCLTNLNRQIIATRKTVGKYKTEVMKERMLEINPNVDVRIHNCFFLPENADEFPFDEYDYIIDAVDTVTAKISIIMKANELGIPVISSMGAGNKLDPTAFRVADIYKTRVCPLAKVMRRELKKRGVKKLKVVYSEEQPTRPIEDMSISCRTNCICPPGAEHKCTERRDIPGSVAFVPSVVGLIIAGEVIKDIAGVNAK